MLIVQNSKYISRSPEAEKNEDRSTFNGRAGGRRNLNVSGLASFSQILQGVMPGRDFFIQSGKYPVLVSNSLHGMHSREY